MCDALLYDLLCRLAYQAWLDRGKPLGTPEVDWEYAQQQVANAPPIAAPKPEMLDATNDA